MPILIDNSRVLGRGAMATVHPIVSDDERTSAAKIYHDAGRFDREKIDAMIFNPPDPLSVIVGGHAIPQFAWPAKIIMQKGLAVGFMMPRIDKASSLTLDHFYDVILLRDRKVPRGLPIASKLEIARNLCAAMSALHARSYYVVDFKPQNVMVHRTANIVALLDCDSYSIRNAEGKRFPATNYSSQYIAPEALVKSTPPRDLGEDQDRFALAVVLFQLMNNGIHPFQGIQAGAAHAPSTDDKVRQGLYAHGLKPNPEIGPRPQSVHACWDDAIRTMFDRAFTGPPGQRPKAVEWTRHLHEVLRSQPFESCQRFPHDPVHIHFAGKACMACHRDAVSRPPRPVLRSPPGPVKPTAPPATPPAPPIEPAKPSRMPLGQFLIFWAVWSLGVWMVFQFFDGASKYWFWLIIIAAAPATDRWG